MARRCVTVPGPGLCCQKVQQLGFEAAARGFPMPNGRRCGSCTVIQRRGGRGPGFQFRFRHNSTCAIGPSGCVALTQGAGGFAPGMGAQAGGLTFVPTVQ